MAAARAAATAVLSRLGLQDADIAVDGAYDRGAFVRADPRVDGLATSGFTTFLQLDGEHHVVGGSGYVGRPERGPSYPLVSATAAFHALPEMPRPMMLCPATASCPEPAPAKVTGVELGLQLTALADEQAALLPAWLFTVEGWPMPLAQAAIEPRFLQLPKDEPVTVDPGGGTEPAPPPQSKPVDPPGPRSAFAFDAVFSTADPKGIVVQYGDSSSCPHTHVTHAAKESAESVVVMLEADAQPADQVCTADYRKVLVTVALQEPLGTRTVIEGSTGKPVAVSQR